MQMVISASGGFTYVVRASARALSRACLCGGLRAHTPLRGRGGGGFRAGLAVIVTSHCRNSAHFTLIRGYSPFTGVASLGQAAQAPTEHYDQRERPDRGDFHFMLSH